MIDAKKAASENERKLRRQFQDERAKIQKDHEKRLIALRLVDSKELGERVAEVRAKAKADLEASVRAERVGVESLREENLKLEKIASDAKREATLAKNEADRATKVRGDCLANFANPMVTPSLNVQ